LPPSSAFRGDGQVAATRREEGPTDVGCATFATVLDDSRAARIWSKALDSEPLAVNPSAFSRPSPEEAPRAVQSKTHRRF
jgi:hypothetical protein